MTNTQTLRILPRGGVISPGDFRKICQTARECGTSHLSLGARQEIFLQTAEDSLSPVREQLTKINLPFEVGFDRKANIVTSYAAMGIFPSTQWLLADTYLDILEKFDYQPRLKINITDPQQPLVPRFSGELNFLASAYPTFWHLYLQLPALGGKLQTWPVLIEGDDIAKLCYVIEQITPTQQPGTLTELVEAVIREFPDLTTRPAEASYTIPRLDFPRYEGFQVAGAGFWLGIFRRNHAYPVDFLEGLCDLCTRFKIGKINLTPWKTLLIKDIRAEHRLHWEKLLGTHGISTQHAAAELNWQLPDLDPEALQLKKELVHALEDQECPTRGLSFAVQTQCMPIATSVVIEPAIGGEKDLYQIRHTVDFTRSNAKWRIFAQRIPREALAEKLCQLCHKYYHSLSSAAEEKTEVVESATPLPPIQPVHQCMHCLTVYDPVFGDPGAGIAPNTVFAQLPNSYVCSLCDAPKSEFISMNSGEKVVV